MNLFELSAKITLDTAEYRAQVEKSKQEMKEAEKGMKDAGAQTEVLKNKLSFLTSQYKNATDTVNRLRTEFNESMRTTGALSDETQALAKQLDTAEKEARDLKNALDQYTNTTDKVSKNTKDSTDSMGTAWAGWGTKVIDVLADVASKAIAVTKTLTKMGFEFNRSIEDYTTSFTTTLKSAEKAAAFVEKIKEMASETPFGMGDLAMAADLLLGYGVNAEKVIDIMSRLGDVARGNKERLSALANVYGQVSSTGKLMTQDLNQMAVQAFQPLNEFSELTGLSIAQLRDIMSGASEESKKAMLSMAGLTDYGREIIERGYISADDLYNALVKITSEGGTAFNGMAAASKTFSGLISTLKDDIDEMLGTLTGGAFNFVKERIPDAISLIAALKSLIEGKGDASGVAQLGTDLLFDILDGIAKAADENVPKVVAVIESVIGKIDIAKLAGAGGKLIGKLANALATILRGGGNIIAQLAPALITAIPVFLEALFLSADFEAVAMSFFQSNADILGNVLPVLVSTALHTLPDVIAILMDGLSKAAPEISMAAFEVSKSIISGIANAVLQLVIDIIPSVVNSAMNAIFGAGEVALSYLSGEFNKLGWSGAAAELDKAQNWLNENTLKIDIPDLYTFNAHHEPTDRPSSIGDISVNVSVPTTNASPEEIGDAVAEAMAIALGEYTGRKGATHGTKPIMAR